MIPILYKSNETNFKTQGIGSLNDAISCYVDEKRNGKYELEMEYPISGIHYEDLKVLNIIGAVPSEDTEVQLFRIYQISKPINGKITVNAEHISYQLSYIPVKPFNATGAYSALNGLKNNSMCENPFEVWTDVDNAVSNYIQTEPSSFRSRLGGVEGSILDCFGGEYEFDNYTVKLHSKRGVDRTAIVEYGKNITDLKQEEKISNVVTGIVPFWKNISTGKVVMLDTPVESEYANNYPFKRTIVHDFSQDFDEEPTLEQLKAKTESYIKSNLIGLPEVSIDVSFVSLRNTEEYKNLAAEKINLCDVVTVRFLELGVDVKAKVVETKYDVLNDKYSKISVGSVRGTLSSSIANIVNAQKDTKTFLNSVVENATNLITGGLGGHVVINKNSKGEPIEILIMDTDNKDTAVNVLRMNMNGIGFSTHGYNGPFETAWTIDGKFVADYIASGTINAINIIGSFIKGSTLQFGSDENKTVKVYGSNTGVTFQGNGNINMSTQGMFDLTNYVAGSNYSTTSNRIYATDSDKSNGVWLLNRNTDTQKEANRIHIYKNKNGGSSGFELLNYSDDSKLANTIMMASGDSNDITIRNSDKYGKLANSFMMESGNSNRIGLYQYDIAGNTNANVNITDHEAQIGHGDDCYMHFNNDGYIYIKVGGEGAYKCGFVNIDGHKVLAAL